MSDILNKLKDYLLDNKFSNIPEIKFLQESDIILSINRGFTELYRNKPKNPILFLSKWLSRESLAKELEQEYRDNKIKRENLETKYYQQKKQKYILEQRNNQQIKLRKDDEDYLITEIKSCKDFWLGFNHICERLKTLTKATGCYIGIYDQKRRPVKEDDDMDGHLDPSGTKVLRYISWNDDHNFLEGKCLEPNEGVTFDLITAKPQENQQENQQEKNEEQKNEEIKEKVVEKKIEENVKSLMIEDVVNDNRIKFFREPRLGCYFALDLTYKTSLSYKSLLSAIECTKNYETAKEEQETRKKEWSEKQEEIRNQIKELKETKIKEEEARKIAEENEIKAKLLAAAAENDPSKLQEEKKDGNGQGPNPQVVAFGRKDIMQELVENIENLEKQLTNWEEEPVKLVDYEKEEKNIYMCLDTLGQDRIFTEEEINYIKKIGVNIRESMEKLEQSLLEKDRDIRIKFLDNEVKLKTDEKYSDEKFEETTTNYIAQYFQSEEYKSKNITEEIEKSNEGELEKMRYYKSLFLEGDCLNILLTFQEFEFVEQLKVFQNLFYFAKMNPIDINENKTNKLEWKKARQFWKDVFPYIIEYNPIGPKPEQVKQIYKLNKIKENLEACLKQRDEIKAYSQTLVMLVDLILHLIKVRHDNIIYRLCKTAIYKDKREKIIKENTHIDEERQKIIDAAKALNPNVRIPGEIIQEEEKKEEEKKEEENQENKELNEENTNQENKEEIKEPQPHKEEENKENNQEENKENEEQNEQENQDELDSAKLAEDLEKFDEEHPKQEIPPDVEYDIDNDYDIEQSEKDTEISNALQAANNAVAVIADKEKEKDKDKNKVNLGQSIANNNNNNGQPANA